VQRDRYWGFKEIMMVTCEQYLKQKMIVRDMSNKISDILTSYGYENNNIETRKIITEKCNDVLKDIPFAYFNVVCDESNNTADVIDRNQLKCDIAFNFNIDNEFTIRRYTICKIGVTFDEVLNEGE
jgi:hypothetical protein